MAHRPSSPSARFYEHRSTPNTPQMDQQLRPTAATESPRAHYFEPFADFQGFSPLSTRHEHTHPRFGVYGYRVPEGDVSPRMLISNPVECESLRPRVQTLVSGQNEHLPQPRIYQFCSNSDSGSNVEASPDQNKAVTQQWLPFPHHNMLYPPTPPCTYTNDFIDQARHFSGGHNGETSLPPTSFIKSGHPNTFRVPSDSEPGHLSGTFDSTPSDALSNVLDADQDGVAIPSSILGEGTSTIYPDDSVSTAPRAAAFSNAHPRRTLADDVIEIHDICLAVTKRYLESLRVNWDLRNGHPVGEGGGPSMGGGPVRDPDHGHEDRRAPHAGAGSRKRAHSESHLLHLVLDGNERHHRDGGHHHTTLAINNPIPHFTNSLLHNIRLICDLLWTRAQRDREDVLGAEARCCRDMSFLHECGETIVLYNAADAEDNPERCMHRVVSAGTGICRALQDWEGLRLMGDEELGEDGQNKGW